MLEPSVNAIYWFVVGVLTILAVGGLAYYLLAIILAKRLQRTPPPSDAAATHRPPMSLLKPLCGAELELEQCLQSFFTNFIF